MLSPGEVKRKLEVFRARVCVCIQRVDTKFRSADSAFECITAQPTQRWSNVDRSIVLHVLHAQALHQTWGKL